MSKTKKKMFYSAIVAVVILLTFVAVTFLTATNGNSVISEVGEGQNDVYMKEITTSDADYSKLDVVSSVNKPGTIDDEDFVTNNVVSGASAVSNATQLDAALKTNGNHYLTGNIEYTASTGSSSAATSGTFGGVLYGNGYTVTVNVPANAAYSFNNSDGTYGFLVKYLTGTIKDLNVVINAASSGSYFGFSISSAGFTTQPDGDSARAAKIGGIAGGISSGLIHNCTVTFNGTLRLQNDGAELSSRKTWSADTANIFGGVAAIATGGVVSYTNVIYNGSLINVGQQNDGASNRLAVNTGGFIGQVGDGKVYLRKISLLGSGTLESEAHTYDDSWNHNDGYATVLTGGLIGWVSSASNAGADINGVYINLTKSGGAIKSNYPSTGGVAKWACSTSTDSIDHDYGDKNSSSSSNASEMRDSYGIGAMYRGKTVVLNNVYMTASMAHTIKTHHPFAINEIAGKNEAKNYWIRYNWTYTLVDASTLGNEFVFARNTAMDGAYSYTSSTASDANAVRGVYYRVSNQSEKNFVYQIKQGSDSAYDLYSIYTKTYNNFGTNGTVYVPAMYTGYVSTNDPDIGKTTNKIDTSTFTSSNPTGNDATAYNVSAIYGSYLYMDFDMSKGYDGTDRLSDGYQGSGNNYIYTYNGDRLYVPAFAGYKTAYGSGEKVNFTQDELNSMGMSSTNFTLSSSYTIVNSGNVDYSHYNYLHWDGAGNVGTYTMTFNKSASDPKFISKDGQNYYCSFMDSYPSKTVEVVPCVLEPVWNVGNLVYDGTAKDVSVNINNIPQGTGLGNNDAANLSVAVAYSADNVALLVQNKPYHAGDYTANATLTYSGTTENPHVGNFTLSNPSQTFNVGKVDITVTPGNAESYYGDDHALILGSVAVTTSDNWIGDDKSKFIFKVRTVFDTINFTTVKGDYATTVDASLAEGATPELLTDYNFVVNNGTLKIKERPINGTLTINEGVYNGSDYVATLSLDEGVRISTDVVFTLDYVLGDDPVSTVRNAGEYLVRITPEENKYTIGTIVINGKEELYAYGETKLTVKPRTVDVTLSFDNGFVYDGKNKVTGYEVQTEDGDAGVLGGEDAQLTLSYNGETEAVLPADYTTVAAFGNSNYTAGVINGGSFTVERADLSEIRIDGNSAVYDGTEKGVKYTLVGVAGEENIESLVGNISITYNNSTSLPVNAGEYSVEISVAEGAAYNAASISATFTVNKAQITFDPVKETTYTGKNIEPEYSVSAPGMDDASSLKSYISVSHTVIHNASTYDITLDFAGTANYEAKQEKYQLEVKRADLAVTLEDGQTMTYNRRAQTPEYNIAAVFEGDEYGDVTVSVTGEKVIDGQAINASTYTFTLDIAQSVNYNAFSKTVTFTIEKYVIGLLGATEQFVTVIRDGDRDVTEISRYITSMDIALVDDTGVYTKDELRYLTKVNGEEAQNVAFSDGKAVFTAEISIEGLDTDNYEFAGAVITVNILNAHITITVNGEETALATAVFGDVLSIEAKGSYGDNAEEAVQEPVWYAKGESGEYDVQLSEAPVSAGDYMAMFRYTFGPDSNYVTRALYLTISPKPVTVTLDGSGVNIAYGDDITEDSFSGATYTTDAGDMSLTISYSTTAVKYSDAGSYPLYGEVAAVTDGDVNNYVFNVVSDTVKVSKKTVYVKANDVSAIYGDEVILSGFTVYSDDGNTVWEDYAGATPLRISLSVDQGILVVGSYDIAVTDNGGNDNYKVLSATTAGKLNISKRVIQITVNDVNVVYGDSGMPVFTGSITSGSLVNGDSLKEITGQWIGSETLGTLDADSYTLSDYMTFSATLNSAQDGTNYEISFADTSKLVISPKKVSVVFIGWQSAYGMVGTENKVTYNARAWTPSATVDGIIDGDSVEVVCADGSEIRNAGKYSRTLGLGGVDAHNYVADECVAELEILPYKTEISVDSNEYRYTYGDVKTAIGQSIRVLDGDTDGGSFTQKYFVGTNTGVTGTQVNWDDVWNAGVYTVVVTYSGDNYTADPVSITVTVDKKKIGKVDPKNDGNLGTSVYSASNVNIDADTVADLSSFAGIEDYIYVVFMLGETQVGVVRNAGEYIIDLRMSENGNYEINGGGESLLNKPATYTITKASAGELNFSLTYANKVYNGNDMSDYIKSVIAVSGINGEPVTGAELVLTVKGESGEETLPVNSGVYSVEVSATGMNNYEDMTSSCSVGNFTIDKVYVALDAITFEDKTVTYDSTTHSLAAGGLQKSAVLKNVGYEYVLGDYVGTDGAVNAGVYGVTVTILFDKLNTRFSDDVSLESYVDEQYGEVYKYQAGANLTINAASPVLNIDKNTLANYFDGYEHTIGFTLAGVGNDGQMVATFDVASGAGQTITIEGLGSFTVTYYTDAAYSNMLRNSEGGAAFPVTVLAENGKTLPYYMMIDFVSSNGNYSDYQYKNNGYDMALYVMQSVVTLSFGSLSVPYGQLNSQGAANDYVKQNMKYTYTVNDEGNASVNYDPEAMLDISYNLTSFDVNKGSYEIAVNAVAAKTEFAGSVTAVIRNAGSIKLNITAAEVTGDMTSVFTDVSDVYGNKTYTASDFNWKVTGLLNENVDYTVSYNGDSNFEISDAGEYILDVSIPEGNYKAWNGTVKLDIAKVGVDVVWSMNGEAPEEGVFTKTYDGKPADLSATAVGADGITLKIVYVNSEGDEIDAPVAVGTHTAKAVVEGNNYYVNEDSAYVTVVIEAIVLDEETIRGWIHDDSDVYGSVQGIDITGLPEGFGATSIVYVNGDVTYDMNTVKNAVAGEYLATVTVSNGSSSGSATFRYTVTKRDIVFTVNMSGTSGKALTASDASLTSDISLASGDSASVSSVKFKDVYNKDLAFGVYNMADYVSEVEIKFSAHADCYNYRVVMGEMKLAPSAAPEVVSVTANYNTVTVTFKNEGVYAYRIGTRGNWISMSNASNTLIISGLKADSAYTIYFSYAGFTQVNTSSSAKTTADPSKILEMIDEILEGGLTLEKQEQYDSILAYYETIAESDRPEIQAEYDALVAQFNAISDGNGGNGGGTQGGINAVVIAVCSVCAVLIVASIAGVIIAAVFRKRRMEDENYEI